MYHRVDDRLRDSRDVSVATFDRHMAYLRLHGFTALHAGEVHDVLRGARPWPKKPVALTFDDGTVDNFINAYPVLQRYGLKAIFFVVTGRPEAGEPGFMSWQQMRELIASGLIDVQSHTHRHRKDNLELLRAGRRREIEDDLVRSRDVIERRLGGSCRYLAWPQGHFNEELLEMALAAGYRATFTTRHGPNTAGTLLALRRFKVKERSVGWLAERLWIYSKSLPATLYAKLRSGSRPQ